MEEGCMNGSEKFLARFGVGAAIVGVLAAGAVWLAAKDAPALADDYPDSTSASVPADDYPDTATVAAPADDYPDTASF
jgi:hypothetical protein